MRYFAVLFAFLSIFLPPTAYAEVYVEPRSLDDQSPVFLAFLFGDIAQGDFDVLHSALESSSPAASKVLVLESEGGNLSEAMKIGRLVRAERMDVQIMESSVCYSACVFILAAGIGKIVDGPVGIHRPYFTFSPGGSVAEGIKAKKVEVERYFMEMNIPTRLAEDMFSIGPTDMRILTDDELRDYRLNSMDFAESEALSVGLAEQSGLSREAYEAYRLDMYESCTASIAEPRTFNLCKAAIAQRHGVTLP